MKKTTIHSLCTNFCQNNDQLRGLDCYDAYGVGKFVVLERFC